MDSHKNHNLDFCRFRVSSQMLFIFVMSLIRSFNNVLVITKNVELGNKSKVRHTDCMWYVYNGVIL